MFGTILNHHSYFYFEIEVDGHRTLGALSSPLIVQHGQRCDTAFKAGDKVRLVATHGCPSIVSAA